MLGPGAGDNAAAALGLGARAGDVVVSIGTSGTVFAVSDTPTAEPTGTVAGFADATGRYLPLVCTLNAARVLDAAAGMVGVDHDELSGSRCRPRPARTGSRWCRTWKASAPRTCPTPPARSTACAWPTPTRRTWPGPPSRACCAASPTVWTRSPSCGVPVHRILLIGGGARSEAVRAIAPAVLGLPVTVPPPGEYVADGAAAQAAWVLEGSEEPPRRVTQGTETYDAKPLPEVRERYHAYRDRAA